MNLYKYLFAILLCLVIVSCFNASNNKSVKYQKNYLEKNDNTKKKYQYFSKLKNFIGINSDKKTYEQKNEEKLSNNIGSYFKSITNYFSYLVPNKSILKSLFYLSLITKTSGENNYFMHTLENDKNLDIKALTKNNLVINSYLNNYTEIFSNSEIIEDDLSNINMLLKVKIEEQDNFDILYGIYSNGIYKNYNISFGHETDTPIKLLNNLFTTIIIGNSENNLYSKDSKYSFVMKQYGEAFTISYFWYNFDDTFKAFSGALSIKELAILSRLEKKNNPGKFTSIISFFNTEIKDQINNLDSINITDKIGNGVSLYDIIYTQDGGLLGVGWDHSIPIYLNPIIIKILNKEEEWSKQIYFTSDTKTDPTTISNAIETKNKSIVTCGLITDKFDNINFMSFSWITMLQKDGNIEWLEAIKSPFSIIYNDIKELNKEELILHSILKNYTNIFSIINKNGTLINTLRICPKNQSLNILSINTNDKGEFIFGGRIFDENKKVEPIFGKLSDNFSIGECEPSYIELETIPLDYEFLDPELVISKDFIQTKDDVKSMDCKYENIKNVCYKNPTNNPTIEPTYDPSNSPSLSPTLSPTSNPALSPTKPTSAPTKENNNVSMLSVLILTISSIVIFFCCCYLISAYLWFKCRKTNNKDKTAFLLEKKKDEEIINKKISYDHDVFIINDKDKDLRIEQDKIEIDEQIISNNSEKIIIDPINSITDEGIPNDINI